LSSLHRIIAAPPAGDGERVQAVVRAEWRECFLEACELLWPPPAVIMIEPHWHGRPFVRRGFRRRAQGSGNPAEFALVPGIGRPPLLVPRARRAAAAAVRHYSAERSTGPRLALRAFSLGLGGALVRGRVRVNAPAGADTIEAYLSAVLARDVRVSMYLGPARANRKPVLQILTAAGEAVGFAKIGANPVTRELVRSERDSLAWLGGAELARIAIPNVLHYDTWHGLDVLVLSALPAWLPRRPLPAARLAAAMSELAGVGGLRQEPVHGGDYLRRLRSRLVAADEGAEQADLLRALDLLTERMDDRKLTFGAWHGDWAPWNMASTGRGLVVWDWERFAFGVPVGFDALHHWLQAEVGPGHRQPRSAAAACPERAPELLAPFGIGAQEARLTAILYLAELATRYLADRQAAAGAPLGAPGTWLIPAIAGEIAR
jgi:hypothetical protein